MAINGTCRIPALEYLPAAAPLESPPPVYRRPSPPPLHRKRRYARDSSG